MARRDRWLPIEQFYMEMEGSRRIILTGCRGICAYTEECVALYTSFGIVSVYGQGLEMGCMTRDGATITGKVQRIELSEGE